MNHISLFSGIGGDTLAAQWAGFNTVLFVENDDYCQKVLKKHWPNVPIIGDIHDVKGKEIKETITLITGGFPCQPFSVAGKQRGKEDDRYLWPEMLRVIKEVKPTWVVAENVAGFVRMGLNDCISNLENEGFEVQPFLIPACAVNAPHRRDRVFIVAHNKNVRVQRSRPIRKQEPEVYAGQKLSLCRCSRERTNQWAVEPNVGRVANGVPSRMDRLKCLGNAIVPQQIYPILKAIADIELTKGG